MASFCLSRGHLNWEFVQSSCWTLSDRDPNNMYIVQHCTDEKGKSFLQIWLKLRGGHPLDSTDFKWLAAQEELPDAPALQGALNKLWNCERIGCREWTMKPRVGIDLQIPLLKNVLSRQYVLDICWFCRCPCAALVCSLFSEHLEWCPCICLASAYQPLVER